jgi:CBS domain-containing protein
MRGEPLPPNQTRISRTGFPPVGTHQLRHGEAMGFSRHTRDRTRAATRRWGTVKALGLAGPQETLRAGASAQEAALVLSRIQTSAALVVDGDRFVGVVTDENLLRALLPSYVGEADALARVLEEDSSEQLWQRLEGRTVRDLIVQNREEEPVVDGGATLVEVASVMVRAEAPIVAVVEDGRLIGGITIDHLLTHLLSRR